jgi:aspartokinase/homoserine dehydrogenase 1
MPGGRGPIRLSLLQIGKGTVGATLIDQVREQRLAVLERLGVDVVYAGIAGRRSAAFEAGGIDLARWRQVVEAGPGASGTTLLERAAGGLTGPAILVDATAEDGMAGVYRDAFAAGLHVVTCNKKPLAGPLAEYRGVQEAARGARRFWLYEVTVGAGLPVLSTLRDLLDSGDALSSVEGCFSGTLNFLCASLDGGGKFSEVLARAVELGYTEPDPREDLAGQDVARKALILAREAGLGLEPAGVKLEPFCPIDRRGDVKTFLEKSAGMDSALAQRWRDAAARSKRLRYVASVGGGCVAGLNEVPAAGALGGLSGPDNVFVFRTRRYAERPLVVTGPGAGPAVTAAGAFGDILKVARAIAKAS